MKILYHHRIASKDGQYVHVEELTNAFKELGHQLYFVAPESSKKSDFGNDGGLTTKLKKLLPRPIYELLELGYSLLIAVKLIAAILKFKPDFIYERYNLYQPVGVILAKIFRIPIALEVNAPLVDEREKYSGLSLIKFARFIENFTWKTADYVLPVTNVLAKIIEKTGVDRNRIHVIQNGINKNLLDREFKKKEKFNTNRIVIGFVGFINPWHRLDIALDAIAAYRSKNIHLICIGDGDIKKDLEEQAKRLDICEHVTFTGLVTRDEVFGYIQNFDIALQPAVTAYASPLKLFEYLGASCLIIAPNSENICEILSDDNSILFESDNYQDFSSKLSLAVEKFDTFDSKRIQARETIFNKGFTWQQNAQRVIDLITESP